MEEKEDIEPTKNSQLFHRVSWKLVEKYFKSDVNNLVAHHLDSYNNFFEKGLFDVFKDNNPISFSENEEIKINLYLGGRDARAIYFGKPVLYDDITENIHYMYPNEARLRNLTYGFSIHYDVLVEYEYSDGPEIQKIEAKIEKVLLGKFPIMLHSNFCILNGLASDISYNLGECRNDHGGYFIIDGKEKVIIPQEKFADNMLYLSLGNDTYSHIVNIRSVSEDLSKPRRTTSVRMVAPTTLLTNNNIVVNIPNVRKPIPLFIVMRALGVISDKQIIETCLLNLNEYSSLVDLFIPSVHDANKIFTQDAAITFISVFVKRGTQMAVMDILTNYLLPHIGDTNFLDKAYYLGFMVFELLSLYTNKIEPTNRDSFKYKRIELSGTLIKELFIEYYKIQLAAIFRNIDRLYYYKAQQFQDRESFLTLVQDHSDEIFKTQSVYEGFKKAFKGNWGSTPHTKRIGLIQDLNRLSYNSFISHLRKINLPLDENAKVVGPRLLHNSQWGYIDIVDSPDGGNIGLHKHMAIATYINSEFSAKGVIEWLKTEGLEPLYNNTPNELNYYTKIFVNGAWIGILKEPIVVLEKIKLYKRNGLLPIFMSCSFHYERNIVFIYTDEGRLYRPIYYIQDEKVSAFRSKEVCQKVLGDFTWENMVSGFIKKDNYHYKNNKIYDIESFEPKLTEKELEENKSVVDYIDVAEEEYLLISNIESPFQKKFTNTEIHPSLIFGVMGNQIIYPENNPYPRNTFSCAHGKQAVSVFHSNYLMRIDKTSLVLNYGHVPLIKSKYLDIINKEEQPYGNNVICAIMSYNGYNVEDAILINEGSIQRGLFNTTYYTSYETHEEKVNVGNSKINTRFTSIQDKPVLRTRPEFFYDELDENGLIKENTVLNDKLVLIGKVQQTETNDLYDASIFPKKGQLGVVDKSFITESEEGTRIAKIRIREERIPSIGDKMASRAGQKGTIGMIIRECDMPFTDDGVKPDLIINPHALPSRMTIGQLLESLFGKLCLEKGCFGDSTAFNMKGPNLDFYGDCLTEYGFHSSGNQLLYNGITGEQIKSDIFIGPTYYSRLKHMVKDKINYRALGPKTSMTRQSVQGRANDGGLRIGEMERDSILAHGAMIVLNDSFLKRGDEYFLAICNHSGMVAIFNRSQNIFLSPYVDGPIKFNTVNGEDRIENISRFGRSFSIIRIPYALKLLIYELQTMNVQMRIITDENIDQIENMNYSNNVLKLDNNYENKIDVLKNHITNYLEDISNVKGNYNNPFVRLTEPKETKIRWGGSEEKEFESDPNQNGVNEDDDKEDGVIEDGVNEDGVIEDGVIEDGVIKDGVIEDGDKEDGEENNGQSNVEVNGQSDDNVGGSLHEIHNVKLNDMDTFYINE